VNIHVRHSEPRDAPAIHDIHTQPGVIAGTLQLPYQPESLWKERIENPKNGVYSLVAEVEERVVGSASLFSVARSPGMSHRGALGMSVHPAFHGRGVGTALMEALLNLADNWLNWTRVELTVFIDNEPAIHLYEKFGFVIEGTHRKYAFRNGQYVDAHCMARVR